VKGKRLIKEDILDKLEKITFQIDEHETVDFFILEQTRINGVDYLFVTDVEEGDGDAYILRDYASAEEKESIYQIVSDEEELEAVSAIFESLLEDIEIER